MTTAEEEFRNWLDGVSPVRIRNCSHRFVVPMICDECRRFLDEWRLEKPLDERLEDKEKRIKRKIQSRLRAQKKRTERYEDSKLSIGEIDEWIQKRL